MEKTSITIFRNVMQMKVLFKGNFLALPNHTVPKSIMVSKLVNEGKDEKTVAYNYWSKNNINMIGEEVIVESTITKEEEEEEIRVGEEKGDKGRTRTYNGILENENSNSVTIITDENDIEGKAVRIYKPVAMTTKRKIRPLPIITIGQTSTPKLRKEMDSHYANYLVDGVGWTSSYIMRIVMNREKNSISSITCRAQIYNATQVEYEAKPITIVSGNPSYVPQTVSQMYTEEFVEEGEESYQETHRRAPGAMKRISSMAVTPLPNVDSSDVSEYEEFKLDGIVHIPLRESIVDLYSVTPKTQDYYYFVDINRETIEHGFRLSVDKYMQQGQLFVYDQDRTFVGSTFIDNTTKDESIDIKFGRPNQVACTFSGQSYDEQLKEGKGQHIQQTTIRHSDIVVKISAKNGKNSKIIFSYQTGGSRYQPPNPTDYKINGNKLEWNRDLLGGELAFKFSIAVYYG